MGENEKEQEKAPKKQGKRIKIFRKFSISLKVLLIVAILVIPAAIFGGKAFLHATSKASFCISCHEMGSACNTWTNSKHSRAGVECIDCHVKPGTMNYLLAKVLAARHGFYHIVIRDPEKMKKAIRESAKAHWESCVYCHKDMDKKTHIYGLKIKHHNDDKTKELCTECHWKIAHADVNEKSHPERKGCFNCHNDVKAPRSKCEICHPTQGEHFYSSFKGKAGLQCLDCHIPVKDFKASKQSCLKCHRHNEKYSKIFEKWQSETSALMSRAEASFKKASEIAEKSKDANFKKKFNELKDVYEKFKWDKSKGVHNFEVITEKYKSFIDNIENLIGMVDTSYKHTNIEKKNTKCEYCHTDVLNTNKGHDSVFYKHSVHLDKVKMTCLDCHTPFENHGKLIAEDCISCHHWNVKEDKCVGCHIEVKNLYYGTIPFGKKMKESFKATAGIKCVDCHKIANGKPQKGLLVKSQCINCHDEKYGAKLDEWIVKEEALLKKIELLMRTASDKDKRVLDHIKRGKPLHNIDLVEKYLKSYK